MLECTHVLVPCLNENTQQLHGRWQLVFESILNLLTHCMGFSDHSSFHTPLNLNPGQFEALSVSILRFVLRSFIMYTTVYDEYKILYEDNITMWINNSKHVDTIKILYGSAL